MAATQRVQIDVGFTYPQSVWVAGSSGGSPTSNYAVFVPASGAAVTVTNRINGQNPVIYTSATGTGTIGSLATDTGGNVPGWVIEGSYQITASAIGNFAGATVAWEATRGDGVENLYPGSVTPAALTTAVANMLVPTGTMLDYAGTTPPAGYVMADGAQYPIGTVGSTYNALYGVISTLYNVFGDAAGTFRVPNHIGKFALTKAASGTGSTLGQSSGTLDHVHNIPPLAIPQLTVPGQVIPAMYVNSHTHSLSAAGGAQISLTDPFGALLASRNGGPVYQATNQWATGNQSGYTIPPNTFLNSSELIGTTDAAITAIVGGVYSTSPSYVTDRAFSTYATTTDPLDHANPPFLVSNKIIKL